MNFTLRLPSCSGRGPGLTWMTVPWAGSAHLSARQGEAARYPAASGDAIPPGRLSRFSVIFDTMRARYKPAEMRDRD